MKLVGERRALAAIIFAFFFILFFLNGLALGSPDGNFLFALAGCYGLAFFALVAGYFWARWFAVGVGLFGVIVAAVSLWQAKSDPDLWELIWRTLVFFGGTHLVATVMLWGDAMAVPYDGQTKWREKLHMDDNAVQRLGRSVIRAGVGLPFVLAYAFAPKPESAQTALALTALALTGFGLRAVVRAKTWGVIALGLAGTVMVTLAFADFAMGAPDGWVLRPALAGGLLFSAAAPWFAPLVRSFAAAR
jgi:hypothetical protein